jgi:hypothetical protein
MASVRPVLVMVVPLATACGPTRKGDDDDDDTPDAGTVAVCTPDASESCSDGPANTQGVGPCAAGTRTCGAGGQWGPCTGQVLPVGEICGKQMDDKASEPGTVIE